MQMNLSVHLTVCHQWQPLTNLTFSFPIGRLTLMMSSPRMSRFTFWLVLGPSVRGTFVPNSAQWRVSALKYAVLNTYLQPLGLEGPWGPKGLPYISVFHYAYTNPHSMHTQEHIVAALFSVSWIIHTEVCTLSMGFLYLKNADNVSCHSVHLVMHM